MELHYAKHDKYEDEEREYDTWFWNDDQYARPDETPYGWNKRPVPNFISSEAEQAAYWFKTSNREDIIFLEKEKMACEYWYDAEMKSIHVAMKIEK